ncbi:TPA: PAAR domain-containing protein [Raoultella planticola]|uniref:PAAR domain-containing protein n=1 Tax=Raoultella planticola TaxID=575 RepID=UPI001A21773B|nr:PAAR domain-containing protein [Raoultella planticola]HAT1618905.1 PAAR domain-containing protein [Raoultella planticola]
MQQYTKELTAEIIQSCAQPPYTWEEIAIFEESVPQEALEMITRLATRPVKYMFRITTVRSLTRNGGVLQKASGKRTAVGFQVARAGDKVVYADGSEATIISGADVARVMQGASAALVGSMFDNGDEIISTPQSSNRLVFREGDSLPNGFLTMPGVSTNGS